MSNAAPAGDVAAAVVLLVEDNPAQQQLTRRALAQCQIPCDLFIVSDGQQAMDYLLRHGEYEDPDTSPRPDLVLLGLNMPKVDGRQVLKRMSAEPKLATIPVVVLTTSTLEQDVACSYELGCNSYVNKPVDVRDLVELLKQLGSYWLRLVVSPPPERKPHCTVRQ